MKILKLLITVLMTGSCAVSAFAQRKFTYVPQAIKNTKGISHLVNPKMPQNVQAHFVDLAPHVVKQQLKRQMLRKQIPNRQELTTLLNAKRAAKLAERQFAFSYTVATEEYIDDLLLLYNQLDPFEMGKITEKQLFSTKSKLMHAPQYVLQQVEQFIRNTGYFPSKISKNPEEKKLRNAFYNACRKIEEKNLRDDVSLKLLALKEQWVKKIASSRSAPQVLEQMEQFIEEKGYFPSIHSDDPAEVSLHYAFFNACEKAKARSLQDATSQRLLMIKNQWTAFTRRTPQEILEQVQTYRAEHGGRNPRASSSQPEEYKLRKAWKRVYQKYKDLPLEQIEDDASRALVKLYRETINTNPANQVH